MNRTMLEQYAENQTYIDVERMLYYVCGRFKTRFGGELHEYLSVANDAFLRAYLKWDPAKSAFTTYAWHCTWNALRDVARQRRRWGEKIVGNSELSDRAIDSRFNLAEFLRELSDDARIVVHVVLDTPREFADMGKNSVRDYLGRIGWATERISESFSEMRESL